MGPDHLVPARWVPHPALGAGTPCWSPSAWPAFLLFQVPSFRGLEAAPALLESTHGPSPTSPLIFSAAAPWTGGLGRSSHWPVSLEGSPWCQVGEGLALYPGDEHLFPLGFHQGTSKRLTQERPLTTSLPRLLSQAHWSVTLCDQWSKWRGKMPFSHCLSDQGGCS